MNPTGIPILDGLLPDLLNPYVRQQGQAMAQIHAAQQTPFPSLGDLLGMQQMLGNPYLSMAQQARPMPDPRGKPPEQIDDDLYGFLKARHIREFTSPKKGELLIAEGASPPRYTAPIQTPIKPRRRSLLARIRHRIWRWWWSI